MINGWLWSKTQHDCCGECRARSACTSVHSDLRDSLSADMSTRKSGRCRYDMEHNCSHVWRNDLLNTHDAEHLDLLDYVIKTIYPCIHLYTCIQTCLWGLPPPVEAGRCHMILKVPEQLNIQYRLPTQYITTVTAVYRLWTPFPGSYI